MGNIISYTNHYKNNTPPHLSSIQSNANMLSQESIVSMDDDYRIAAQSLLNHIFSGNIDIDQRAHILNRAIKQDPCKALTKGILLEIFKENLDDQIIQSLIDDLDEIDNELKQASSQLQLSKREARKQQSNEAMKKSSQASNASISESSTLGSKELRAKAAFAKLA